MVAVLDAELEQLFRAAYRRERDDPLAHGPPPNPAQEELHLSDAEITFLVAGNRLGKSYAGMREVLWRATMTHPYRPATPHDMIWCGFPSYAFFRETTSAHFWRLCPRSRLIQFHQTEFYARIRRADGGVCTIHFKPYEQGRDKWQGAGVDFIWLDEEPPEDIYREALARVISTDGQILLTCTPVSGMGWLYDRLYLPGIQERARPHGRRRIHVIQAGLATRDPSREYEIGEPLVTHLTREQIVRFAAGIPDPDERAIRLFGEFRTRSGLVYKQFRPETHIVPAFEVPAHWELWAGVDPGYHGFAVLFLAQSPTGRIYVVDEYFSQEESIATRLKAVWERAQRLLAPRGRVTTGDYLVLYVDTEDPQLVREANLWAADHGLPLAFASLDHGRKARLAGITRVQELLTPRPERTTPAEVARPRPDAGEPVLYVFDSLASRWRDGEEVIEGSRLVWELGRYLWKRPPRNQPSAPPPDDADDASAGGAHALSALRYAVMARVGPPDELPEPDPAEAAGRHAWVWREIREEEEQERRVWSVTESSW